MPERDEARRNQHLAAAAPLPYCDQACPNSMPNRHQNRHHPAGDSYASPGRARSARSRLQVQAVEAGGRQHRVLGERGNGTLRRPAVAARSWIGSRNAVSN
jgi:hypothetical protein